MEESNWEAALVRSARDWVTCSIFPACGPSLLFLSEHQFYSYSYPTLTSPFTWPKMTIPSLFLHWFNTKDQQGPTVLPGSRLLVIKIWLVQLGSDPSWWKAALNNLLYHLWVCPIFPSLSADSDIYSKEEEGHGLCSVSVMGEEKRKKKVNKYKICLLSSRGFKIYIHENTVQI